MVKATVFCDHLILVEWMVTVTSTQTHTHTAQTQYISS